jgi:haloacid dehalogenase superfamily, subfamily IA, variant 1 with third motif having Dx(3-4)D or Dx(3-4)E
MKQERKTIAPNYYIKLVQGCECTGMEKNKPYSTDQGVIRYVIFDFDGTLVDSKEVSIIIYNQLAQKYNMKKIENKENLLKLPLLERFKALDVPLIKLPFLVSDITKRYKSLLLNITMFSGIRELLIELNGRGYQLAIISSNSESNIRDYFQQNQLDVIGTIKSSTNIFGKDKVIKKFLTTHRISLPEVIYIGDEIRDVEACKKIGIKIICVEWGYDPIEMLKHKQPDYIVGSPQDILSILP